VRIKTHCAKTHQDATTKIGKRNLLISSAASIFELSKAENPKLGTDEAI
jgi:hypothetical protein